ncbi:MAG TPA: alpha/beta fold hydrolase [Steroidobacteraceae bacterium]|nr:alpha/beta fold hydrolase [Steroidobacteraceae bacterium]
MKTGKLYRRAPWLAPRALAFALGALALAAHAGPACSDRGAKSPEARCEALAFGGRERTYRLYVPARLPAAAPLLVVLHGGGGGGASMESLTLRGLNRRADEDGVLVAYPDGVGHGWNDGRRDLKSKSVEESVDDVGFLRALVDAISRRYPLDRERIFVTGISNGGMMTLRLACDASDLFHGFVAVAASLGADLAPRCRPSAPRPLALIDGTEDPLVPFAGGAVNVLGSRRGSVIGALATFAMFRGAAHCKDVDDEPPLDRVAGDGTALVVRRATGCVDDARIVLYEIDGGGHAWPGGLRYARKWLIGRVSQELDATDEIWRFLGLGAGRRGPV